MPDLSIPNNSAMAFCVSHIVSSFIKALTVNVIIFGSVQHHFQLFCNICIHNQPSFLRVKNIYIVANVCLHVKKAVEFLWSRQKLFIKKSNV